MGGVLGEDPLQHSWEVPKCTNLNDKLKSVRRCQIIQCSLRNDLLFMLAAVD